MKIIPPVCAALFLTVGMTSASFAQHAGHTGHASAQSGATLPTERGDATSAAITEIVQILSQDPQTVWSRVNIEALRPTTSPSPSPKRLRHIEPHSF